MARINIEDSLFREDGFLNLIEKTGNRYTALGMVVSAFILAQKHWIKHKSIPLSEWPESLNLLIEIKLVVQKDDAIYVKGSKEAFLWLERNSNAGKVVSEKKLDQLKKARIKKERIKKAESLNLDRTTPEPALNLSEDLPLTLPLTLPTLSSSNSNTGKNFKETDFFAILNQTELDFVRRTNSKEIEEIKKVLQSQLIFGGKLPVQIKRTFDKFCIILAKVYDSSVDDFKEHLQAIANEKLTDEKVGLDRKEYIQTRIKNKALELYNATK